MNEVKRYDAGCDYAGEEEMVERADGDFVRHEDYAALQQQLTNAQEALKSAGIEADTVQVGVMELVSRINQVVAENAAMKDVLIAVRDHWFKSSGGAQYEWQIESQTLQEAINQELETPATDACLNAVRADAVVEAFVTVFDVCSRDDHIDEKLWNYGVLRVEKHADEYVAQLRAGNAGKDGSHE